MRIFRLIINLLIVLLIQLSYCSFFIILSLKMSTCQHGQKIQLFCATECCAWKDAGGCQACMKKYHNHMGPTIFLKQKDINTIVKKYMVQHNTKPKCRSLQEAVYNYFGRIKNELTNNLDCICKMIINQIGYPYLFKNGQLAAYKRLKNKQYKKLVQKEFRVLYEATLKLDQNTLVKEQSKIYHSQLEKIVNVINQLDGIMANLDKIGKKISVNLQHDNSLLNKINEIIKNINSGRSTIKTQAKQQQSNTIVLSSTHTESQRDQKEKPLTDRLKKEILPRNKKQQSYKDTYQSRNVSIDQTFKKSKKQREKKEKQVQKSPEISLSQKNKQEQNVLSFDHRQNEINAQKQKLIDLMKPKQVGSTTTQSNSAKQHIFLTPQVSKLADSPSKSPQVKYKKQKQIIRVDSCNDKSLNNSSENDNKGSRADQFAHTILPRQESFKKIYDDTEEVIRKTIIVPVQNAHQNKNSSDQCQSPLLKKKKITDSVLQKDKPKINSDKTPSPQKNSPIKSSMKEHQQKSLSLLVKAIGMKAQQAIPHLQSALRYADNNLSAAQYLSFLLLQIGRPKECLTLCNRILQKLENSRQYDQLSLTLNNNKTAALNILGRYSQSIVVLEKCLAVKEKETLYKNLADAYFSIGIYQKAIYNYEKAVELAEQYDQAYYNLAVCLFVQQNYYNAKIAINKALDICPKNANYQELLTHIIQRIQ